MPAEILSFNFESSPVRVVEIDGDPWFVAKDVSAHLEMYWDGARTVEHVPEEWRGSTLIPTPSGVQEMVVLSESGLFFFLIRSDKPKALPLQLWLAGEVLPALRQRGSDMPPIHRQMGSEPVFLPLSHPHNNLLGMTQRA